MSRPMRITKQEFQHRMRLASQAKQSDDLAHQFRDIAPTIAEHDPKLASLLLAAADSIDAIRRYICERTETDPTTSRPILTRPHLTRKV